MRVQVVDPSAFTPPYDDGLCAALAAAGADVELVTSRFGYGSVTRSPGYRVRESFYRRQPGAPGSRVRLAAKLAQHVPGMLDLRRRAAEADVVHFQWLAAQPLDVHLLPERVPRVLTAHDVLPREPRPGALRAQKRLYERMDAVVVHSGAGRDRLVGGLDLDPARVHVIPHGALEALTRPAQELPLPPDLARVEGPVALFFGLIRPYKGLDVLLEAWRGVEGAELWIAGRPRMDMDRLPALPSNVRLRTGWTPDAALPALFRRADLVVLPYREIDQSGVLFTALAFGRPLLLSAVGGFGEIAATGAAELVPPGDPAPLRAALRRLLADPARLAEMAAASRAAARGPYSWGAVAEQTLALYRALGAG
ncbi:MAG TPA: glycosyltransferase family 4 protein [Solirubrobacteraceae bacterium]